MTQSGYYLSTYFINRIHFIAIGGSVMHSLAIALKEAGYAVSGSDDQIFEPARTRLLEAGLLPPSNGWHPERLQQEALDAVVLGMHAKTDNPELVAAQNLNLPIYSFPGFLGSFLSGKKQVVVAGSHGKTTITSMLMHVLKYQGFEFDHVVGAPVPGFDNPVKLGSQGEWALIEGDEYPASCLDNRPKFLFYKPEILILSGIAWDHINAFPTFEGYLAAFKSLLDQLPAGTPVVYDRSDPHLPELLEAYEHLNKFPYTMPDWTSANHQLVARLNGDEYPLAMAGTHNLKNLAAASTASGLIGIPEKDCLAAMQTFKGAAKRLQRLIKTEDFQLFRDFAHAPSKVKATLDGLKAQYPDLRLLAVLELHTFSSLSKAFLPQYHGTLASADEALVLINPKALDEKGSKDLTPAEIEAAFGQEPTPTVCFDAEKLKGELQYKSYSQTNVVLMSSGNFSGADLTHHFQELLGH